MSTIKQDIYILGQSSAKKISGVGEEIRLDLSLVPQPLNSTGSITGTVTSDGNPLPNALIKIMDANYNPIMHAISGTDGTYTLDNLPAANGYNIFCSATGMLLKQGSSFSLQSGQVVDQDFDMAHDPNAGLSIIAGDLIDFSTNGPIGGAVVSLYLLDGNNAEVLQSITYTNQYGQFVFRELAFGKYIVRVATLGYVGTSTNVMINQAGQIAACLISLNQNPNAALGTVSGMVTDNNNQIIIGADVILYLVNADKSLTATGFTQTNSSGVYLFINVPQGNYIVKSNQTTEIVIP